MQPSLAAGVGILELGLDTGGAVGSVSVGAIMAGRLPPHSFTTAVGYCLAWGLAARYLPLSRCSWELAISSPNGECPMRILTCGRRGKRCRNLRPGHTFGN